LSTAAVFGKWGGDDCGPVRQNLHLVEAIKQKKKDLPELQRGTSPLGSETNRKAPSLEKGESQRRKKEGKGEYFPVDQLLTVKFVPFLPRETLLRWGGGGELERPTEMLQGGLM